MVAKEEKGLKDPKAKEVRLLPKGAGIAEDATNEALQNALRHTRPEA